MKRNWILKLLVLLGAIALLWFGINETQADPALRQLMKVSVAELEQGKAIPHDQFLEVADAYLMPYYMVYYTHSRKRGDSAHVFVPLGSKAMQQKAFEMTKVKPVLWVRLDRDFKTKEVADAAMQEDALYLKPYPVSGVVRGLEGSVRDEMSKNSMLQIEQPLALHAGSSPMSFSDGAGVAFGGGLLLLVLMIWTVSDLRAQAWLRSLQRPGVQAFQGRNSWVILAVIAAPFAVVLGGLAFAEWVENRSVNSVETALSLLSLAILAISLTRSRSAALLGSDVFELVRNKKRSSVSLAEVTDLTLDERKVKGVKICKYTLHGPAKPVEVGSSLFKGGLDDAHALGMRLREILLNRRGPVLMHRLQAGERVSFGPLSLSQQGISKGKSDSADVLAWADVQSAKLKNGRLKIKQKGKMFGWGSFATNKIRNIDVLMHVFQTHGL